MATNTVIFKREKRQRPSLRAAVIEYREVMMEVPMIKRIRDYSPVCDDHGAFLRNRRSLRRGDRITPATHRADILNASGEKVTSAAVNRAYYSPAQNGIVMPRFS